MIQLKIPILLIALSATSTLAGEAYYLITPMLNGPQSAKIEITPGSIEFGEVVLGQQRTELLTVTNKGPVTSEKFDVASSVQNPLRAVSNCAMRLEPGGACDVRLQWTPTIDGDFNKTISVLGVQVPVRGKALTPAQLEGGGVHNYNKVQLTQSQSKTWKIENLGQAPKELIYSELPSGFIKGGSCTESLPGLASCDLTLTWAPTAVGAMSAVYSVSELEFRMQGTAIHTVVDYRGLMNNYPLAVVGIGRNTSWINTGYSWLWSHAGAHDSAAPGNFTFAKTVHNPNEVPVLVNLRGAVDNAVTGVTLNGAAVPLQSQGGFESLQNIVTIMLQPGYNVVTLTVNNSGTTNNPAGFSVYFTNDAGYFDAGTDWKY